MRILKNSVYTYISIINNGVVFENISVLQAILKYFYIFLKPLLRFNLDFILKSTTKSKSQLKVFSHCQQGNRPVKYTP